MKKDLFLKRLLLLWVFALSISVWGQTVTGQFLTGKDKNILYITPCFSEDFSGLAGNNTTTGGSNTRWIGNDNFTKVTDAYEAGNAVRLGSSKKTGSLTSKALSTITGDVTVTLDVKGWSKIEGQLKVTLGSKTQTVAYTAEMNDPFETISLNFTEVPAGSTLIIETTSNRAFVDNVKVSCGTETVWNDDTMSWSAGKPDDSKDAVINGNYSGESFTSKSLTVNAGKTLTVNGYVKTGNVYNDGIITVASGANFVQTGTFTSGTGSSFNVWRESQPVKRLAYIAWSSPIDNSAQTLKEFSHGRLDGANQSATGTLANRFYKYGAAGYVATDAEGTFNPAGQGFLIRTPNDFTTAPQVFYGYFTGVRPNTGDITYNIPEGLGNFVFLGNPYPGALDMAAFTTANPGTTGVFYVWNSGSEMVASQYPADTYYTYSEMGTVPAGAQIFGYIPAGQGFIVEKSDASVNSFNFHDSMRNAENSGTFAKNAAEDKFWLEMGGENGTSAQMLIGFDSSASEGYDRGLDARMFDPAGNALYSTVGDKNLIINALGAFNRSSKINISVKIAAAGTYTMKLAKKSGMFSNGQRIFIKDNQTGQETELSAGEYTFTADAGTHADRFTVSFDRSVLGATDGVRAESVIYSAGQQVFVKAAEAIASVTIYDMSGKVIRLTDKVQGNEASFTVLHKGMVIVKLQLQSGESITRKVLLK